MIGKHILLWVLLRIEPKVRFWPIAEPGLMS